MATGNQCNSEVEVDDGDLVEVQVLDLEELPPAERADVEARLCGGTGRLIASGCDQAPVPDRLVSLPQIARILGVSERKAWSLEKTDPRFPRRRPLIRQVKFLLSDVMNYIRALGEDGAR